MPFRSFNYRTQDFLLYCATDGCKYSLSSRSGNECDAIYIWRYLVAKAREHAEAQTRNLEELKRVCNNNQPTGQNKTDNPEKPSSVESWLAQNTDPDPVIGYKKRATSKLDLGKVDFQDPAVLDGSLHHGIVQPSNPMVAHVRRFGGHASGGGGCC
jgi:hypothetical protein